ncbi:unnamed protein product [Allacma fusca]|uniref:Uncharacterized protein n=1 Tax=Allacma fusca TaxID=39272 RepID=A0A8J2JW03_9HEXA|nr:unnamed protein product [Allacma fusca]
MPSILIVLLLLSVLIFNSARRTHSIGQRQGILIKKLEESLRPSGAAQAILYATSLLPRVDPAIHELAVPGTEGPFTNTWKEVVFEKHREFGVYFELDYFTVSTMYSPGGGNYRGGGGGGGRVPDQWSGSRSPEDKRRYPSGPPVEPPPFRERGPGALFPSASDRDPRRDQFDGEPPRKRMTQNPPFVGAGGPGPGPYEKAPPPQDTPNDCEIIAIGNPAPNYVNLVESSIRSFSLKVDVMIPKPNVKISTFIENLAHRGTIFAVVIRPDNEAHKSVSVHVLRGPPKPEEHRNMPLPTAYALIQKCYADLRKKDIGPIPEHIKSLMRYMVDERSLTDQEYAMVIAFLQERRKRQAAFDSRIPYDSAGAMYNSEELQKRILSIFTGDSQAY